MSSESQLKSVDENRWKETLYWLYQFEKKDLALIIVFGVFYSIFSLVTPIGVQTLVNTFLFTGLLQPVLVLVAAIFVGLAIASIFRVVQVYLIELL